MTSQSVLLLGLLVVSSVFIWRSVETDQIQEEEQSDNYIQFGQWKRKYGKQYSSKLEESHRFQIFKKNIEAIEEHNDISNGNAIFGENEYMDLDFKEFQAMKISGHRHAHHGHTQKLTLQGQTSSKIKYLEIRDVPLNVDWRDFAVTKVLNQGNCGGCWAFSTVGALEGAFAIKNGRLLEFSVQQVIDCCRIDLFGCNGGDPIVAFEQCVLRDGVMRAREYPFVGDSDGCFYDNSNLAFSPQDYAIVPPNNSEQLLMAVAQQPVSVCISSGPPFHFYKKGVLDSTHCGDDYDHCVLAIGYGTDEKGVDYWLVKNSWGTDWGEDGYVRIKRDNTEGPGMCGIATEGSYVVL